MSLNSKVLFLDIESSPNVVYSWRVGRKINLTPQNIIDERKIICICYKWLGDRTVHSLDWGNNQNDKKLLKEFSKVINQADVAIGHNGDQYDMKFINGRLAYHSLPPLEDITTIDTLKQSRRVFNINSHKLDYLGDFFSLGRKVETGGFQLWVDVLNKDLKALNKMIRYCKQDVKLLEEVYKKIRSYAPQTVHMGVLENKDKLACKACGSKNTRPRGQRLKTKILYYCRVCEDCNHFWRTEMRV